MKLFFNICIGSIMILGFSQCGSSQKLIETKNTPFKLGEARSESWTSGAEGGATGVNVFIPVEEGREIVLDSVYFRGRVVKLEKVQRDSYLVYIGRIKDDKKKDIIMHADPKQEFGNQPPPLRKKIPFELKEDEAVISFVQNNETKYFKIEKIRPSAPIHYPGAPPIKNGN